MIDKLKIEVFDIIREQDLLKIRYAELEKIKQVKLKEIEKEQNGVQGR